VPEDAQGFGKDRNLLNYIFFEHIIG